MMATKDPIIEEIHNIRRSYAERFDNDLHAIFEEARLKQGKDGRPVVSPNPKPLNDSLGNQDAA